MQTRIALRYTGPAVDSGLMDVYEASANMIAFSDFVVFVSRVAYGGAVETRASIAGFGRGSFVTDLVFNVAGASAAIFTSVDPRTLWWMVKEALALWKHLRGSPPTRVDYEGPNASVANCNGEITQVSIHTLNVVFSEKASASVQRFIHDALGNPGMEAVEISAGRDIARVTQTEGRYYVPVAPSETVTGIIVRMALQLESPVFKEDNKWRFFDGQQSFFAAMEDRDFMARVDAGEAFRKGDVIIADVRISQVQVGAKLTADRAILRVHEHKSQPRQLRLDDD